MKSLILSLFVLLPSLLLGQPSPAPAQGNATLSGRVVDQSGTAQLSN